MTVHIHVFFNILEPILHDIAKHKAQLRVKLLV